MFFSVSRARCSVHTEPDDGSVSISMLNRHIHTLRKRIRRFEEHFEQEKHYKVRKETRASQVLIGSYCLRVFVSPFPTTNNQLSQSHRSDPFFLFFCVRACLTGCESLTFHHIDAVDITHKRHIRLTGSLYRCIR